MTTMIQQRPLEQRHAALRRANAVRTARSELKRDVKAGRRTAADVLACPPECALTMTVLDLLLLMPRVGRSKATRLLSRCALSPAKHLGDLTERQRRVLSDQLRGGRA